MKLLVLTLLLLVGACKDENAGPNARSFYETYCPEVSKVSFDQLHSMSTCQGVNIVVSIFTSNSIALSSRNYLLLWLFKDKAGNPDMKAMEKFREPLSGRSLGHIIGEYGDSGEIWKLISKYQFTDLLLFTDSHKENLFHKIVRNKGIKRLAMSTFCATSSNVIPMVDHKNSFGQTPLELAASLGRFDDLLELYGCQRTPQKMATFFAEFGVELAYRQDLAQYPELFEYLIPHLFSHSTSSKSLFEFHYESEEFSQFISSEERFFDRYMEDPEISRRLVLKRYPLHFGRVDHYGQTTIFYYALSDLEDRELLESILKHTKLDQVNFRGETIFHLFSKTGRRKELKILLKHLPASDFLLRKNSAGATALDVCVDGETCRVLRRATPVL